MLIRRDKNRPAHFAVWRDPAPRKWQAADLMRFLLEHQVPIWFGAGEEQPGLVISFGPLAPAVMDELCRRFPVQDG